MQSSFQSKNHSNKKSSVGWRLELREQGGGRGGGQYFKKSGVGNIGGSS